MYDGIPEKLEKMLGLENIPIAVSFSAEAPEGVERMKGRIRLCQMLDVVRLERRSFSTVSENHRCDGGAYSCGLRMRKADRKSGEFLVKLGLFGSPRAARRFIDANPRIEVGTVKVVSFSPLVNTPFEPDVIVLICNAEQGMKIAESFAYESGKRITGLTPPPICSGIVAAPYVTGEVVYSLGDAGARKYMKIKSTDLFVGIPAELLPEIVENLGKLKFV